VVELYVSLTLLILSKIENKSKVIVWNVYLLQVCVIVIIVRG